MLPATFSQPNPEEIAQAIDSGNGVLIAQYAVAIQYFYNQLAEQLPKKIEAAADAKRDLDMHKAAMKNCTETVKLCQSVLRQLRPM